MMRSDHFNLDVLNNLPKEDGIIDDFEFQQRSMYNEIIAYDYGTVPNITGLGLKIIKNILIKVDGSKRLVRFRV